jgi:membrane protein implicated in regulation of membrane protease activity
MFLLAEVGHPGLFFFLPFACGASVSTIVAIWTDSIIIQALSFLFCSLIAFVVIHVWLKKRIPTESIHHKTNTDALIGLRAPVTQTIAEDGYGYVKVNGQAWRAYSQNRTRIEQGSQVVITAIQGAHVIVREQV